MLRGILLAAAQLGGLHSSVVDYVRPVLTATLGAAYHNTAVDRKESPLLDCSIS